MACSICCCVASCVGPPKLTSAFFILSISLVSIISSDGCLASIPYLEASNCLAVSPSSVGCLAASLSLSNFSWAFCLSAAAVISAAVFCAAVGT